MFIDFKRGDIVNALGQIGVIIDVLESNETNNLCLYVRFIHNVGNARPYDILELSPDKRMGVEKWSLATRQDLEEALARRRANFEQEIDTLLSITDDV